MTPLPQTELIYSEQLNDNQRVRHTAHLFGIDFPMRLEPTVFHLAGQLSTIYRGGYWHFYTLSNGGFYMAPCGNSQFEISSENGFEGQLSGDGLGITACLYAYSLLSFRDGSFGEICAEQYHLLRAFALDHAEVGVIMAAID